MVSGGIVRAARAAAAEGFDALAIGCFYDTALLEAREVSGDMVVTAPCAASLEIAASLANRFGIIVGRRKWVHQMHAVVRDNGMADRLSGFYPVELGAHRIPRLRSGGLRRHRAGGARAAAEGFDALTIGCFYDTALLEAREVSGNMVVTAPCAASLEIAASLANRFGIIVGRRKWVHQMHAVVRDNGMAGRLSGFYPVELGVTDFQTDHAETERRLTAAGRKAVEEDYAEALILGCTLEIGFHDRLSQALGVPVIDPSIAALKRAEYAAGLNRTCGWKPSRRWSCEPPPEAELAAFGIIGGPDVFGNRVVVPRSSRRAAHRSRVPRRVPTNQPRRPGSVDCNMLSWCQHNGGCHGQSDDSQSGRSGDRAP